MKSPANSQPYLPPMEVRKSEQDTGAFRTSEQENPQLRQSEHDASALFDDAVERSGLHNKEVADLCGVSVSLVEKWRSTEARGCPSFAQMLRLPPAFHLALYKAQNKRLGFARAALRRILDDLGELAMVAE